MAASIIAAPATMRSSAPHFITFIIIPRRLRLGWGLAATRAVGARQRSDTAGDRLHEPMRPPPLVRRSDGKIPGSGHPLDHSMSDQTQAGLLAHGSRQRCMAFPGLA
jgi:hypothetical protein